MTAEWTEEKTTSAAAATPDRPDRRSLVRGLLALTLSLTALAGCSESAAPGEVRALTAEELLDPATCKDCPPKHYEQWSGSMHAYASEDPVFIAMNKRGQRETKGELGDFCIKYHAPMAVKTGATKDGLNMADVPKKLHA